jgi:glutamyl-tRNA reductase
MDLLVEGVNHRSAPLEVRERLFLAGDPVRDSLRRLVDSEAIASGAILSTCNRTEFYLVGSDSSPVEDTVSDVMGMAGHRSEWRRHSYRFTGAEATAHMFRVASGLDSAIVGEGQVLGQFKASLAAARRSGTVDGGLDLLMRSAITTAKRVRTETGIARNPVGFAQAAAEQARLVLGSLDGRSALLVGTGRMGASTARVLASLGVKRLFFSTRTPARALRLADAMPEGVVAASVPFSRLDDIAVEVDMIICSTSAPGFVFTADRVQGLVGRRQGRPLFLLDLAVPRDIQPDAGAVPGAHLYNVDDLGRVIDEGLQERLRELPAAEAIVGQEVRRVQAELDRRRWAPAIRTLVAEVERLRGEQLQSLRGKLSTEQLEEVDRTTRTLAARLLHGPISRMHEDPQGISAVQLVGELFDDGVIPD